MISWRDGAVEVDDGVVEGVKEISYSVVEDVFQIEEELTEVFWYCSRVVPPENMIDWATIIMVSCADNLESDEVEEEIDGNVDNGKR